MNGDNFSNRIKELSKRSNIRGIYTYSDFLSPSEQAEVESLCRGEYFEFFGGAEFAERKIVRFGDPNEIVYEEDLPICVIEITVTNAKFTSPLTHRDYLGAILNLGIERDKLGDIFISSDSAYVVADKNIAEFLIDNLERVGHSPVKTSIALSIPNSLAPKIEEKDVVVQTNRVDAIISRVYNLSREIGSGLIADGRVSICGAVCSNSSKELKDGDVVSVRGFGKFVFLGEGGTSKKGKTYAHVGIYK